MSKITVEAVLKVLEYAALAIYGVVKVCKKETDIKGLIFMFEKIPDIMTFKECQKLLKVGKNTLLDLIHSGEIDAFRIGNRWKIPKECVLAYLRYKY